MARPMTTAATSFCPRSVVRNASHSAAGHVPAEIEGRIRCEGGHQNGKNDEIRIVCSGNDHRDRPNFDQRPAGDASAKFTCKRTTIGSPEPSARLFWMGASVESEPYWWR